MPIYNGFQHTSGWQSVGIWKVAVAEGWKLTSGIKYCTRQLWILVAGRKADRKVSSLCFCGLFFTVLFAPMWHWAVSTGTGLTMCAHQPITLGLPANTLMQQKQFPHHCLHLIEAMLAFFTSACSFFPLAGRVGVTASLCEVTANSTGTNYTKRHEDIRVEDEMWELMCCFR